MGHDFDRIQAAVVDGRAHNVYYRQQQIESLCRTLLSNAEKIRQAITHDTGNTLSEVAVEFNLAITTIRKHYASLQPTKFHEEEYAVANGKDAPEARVPVGLVYIEPAAHTLFYSTVVPLSAAISAGNCVIVLLENNLRSTSNLLRQLLPEALSADTFAIASKTAFTNEDFLQDVFVVRQHVTDTQSAKTNELLSMPQSRAIAIVDRTADIRLAAREIVTARLCFGGTSPYAPDIVLVNEFAKKDFLQAIVSECVGRENGIQTEGSRRQGDNPNRVNKKVETLKKNIQNLRIVVQESSFAVVDIPSRLENIPGEKNADPILIVSSIRSLDDAIDLAGRSSSGPYLAAYHFSNPRSAKYLSQFVNAQATFVNHVPRQLLVGPTYPFGRSIDLSERYPISSFELSRPVLVNTSTQSALISTALESSSNSAAQQLWHTAVEPLAVMKKTKSGGVGFFEQGFLMNAALILTSTLTVSGTGMWYLWKYARRG